MGTEVLVGAERLPLNWLRRALADFCLGDRALLRYQLSEWSLTFRLGYHLAHHVDPGWDVDAEYDREGTSGNPKVRDADAETRMRPDLVVHRRGLQGASDNLLFVEVKRLWRSPAGDRNDIDKVGQALMRHSYQVGVALGIGTAGREFAPTWAVYVRSRTSLHGNRPEGLQVTEGEPVFTEAELADLEVAASHAEQMRARKFGIRP